MRTIAITNQKGGSEKTTTAVNIAACLAEQGQRVLLVDLDPQASASSWLNVTSTGRGLTDIFTEDGVSLDGLVMVSSITGLEIIPASPFLLGVERSVAGEPARKPFSGEPSNNSRIGSTG